LLLLELGALEYEYPPLEYVVYELPWLLTPVETGDGILMTKLFACAAKPARERKLARNRFVKSVDWM
jgi:hypothetical protein